LKRKDSPKASNIEWSKTPIYKELALHQKPIITLKDISFTIKPFPLEEKLRSMMTEAEVAYHLDLKKRNKEK